jgi:abhydrolase domain-containing protein 17
VKSFLLLVLVAYAMLVVFAMLTADRQIFLPPPSSYHPDDRPLTMVDSQDDVVIAVRHLEQAEARHTIIFSHGNAEDLGHLEPFLQMMRSAGFNVLAYDYRGYGASQRARPTSRGVLLDAEAVYRHAVAELSIPPDQIIMHGRSVGTGPATHVAANHPVGGLILESGFTSAFRVITRWPILPFDRFQNTRLLAEVQAPVLIIHGARDRIIAPHHAAALYRAASEPKTLWMVEGAGHNDLLYVAGNDYWRTLSRFSRRIEE